MREIEDDLRHRTPDWRERMAAWEERSRNDQPDWVVVRPMVDEISTGGAEVSATAPTGRSWRQGYAPTKHTVKFTRARRSTITALPPRTAQRPEPAAERARAARSRGPAR